MSNGQRILCYRKGSATPFGVRKIGAQSTICRNYPAVGIAPPYLIEDFQIKAPSTPTGEIELYCMGSASMGITLHTSYYIILGVISIVIYSCH